MIHWVDQGSPEWLKLRLGRATGSRVKDVMGTKAKREGYLWELVTERLTGQAEEHFVNDFMRWGTECEPIARVEYEQINSCEVLRPGFITHDDIPWFGVSPDGIVGTKGLEIKCPKTTTHLKWKYAGTLPDDHKWQVLALLSAAKLESCDFMSFDPRLEGNARIFIPKTTLYSEQEAEIKRMESEIKAFLEEVDHLTAKMQE